ncbi:hypothetical protein GCM10020358_19680 [Amorphoplanes nipponensis]|uniref:Deaminase n=1 Tax=Actinoplanes nipponensis TaxID=135950 RepID=A0A919JKW6_9ACTN|nr:dihydrofolate reductase family protein [Actinoplanes nipponensis]GIE48669.1 deaminase [Actinoplanes nipponensis]
MSPTISAELFASADLVVGEPDQWHFPWVDAELLAEVERDVTTATALMLGRTTYQTFAGSWPHRGDDVPLAKTFNTMPKIVVSDTLTEATWSPTTILRTGGDLAGAVAGLTSAGHGRITIAGSVTLVESLIEAGRLDELRLLVHPVIIGGRRRLFAGTPIRGRRMRLAGSAAHANGVQLLVYRFDS